MELTNKYKVVGRIRQGDNLTFKGETVHKTRKGEEIHILNVNDAYEPGEFLTVVLSR